MGFNIEKHIISEQGGTPRLQVGDKAIRCYTWEEVTKAYAAKNPIQAFISKIDCTGLFQRIGIGLSCAKIYQAHKDDTYTTYYVPTASLAKLSRGSDTPQKGFFETADRFVKRAAQDIKDKVAQLKDKAPLLEGIQIFDTHLNQQIKDKKPLILKTNDLSILKDLNNLIKQEFLLSGVTHFAKYLTDDTIDLKLFLKDIATLPGASTFTVDQGEDSHIKDLAEAIKTLSTQLRVEKPNEYLVNMIMSAFHFQESPNINDLDKMNIENLAETLCELSNYHLPDSIKNMDQLLFPDVKKFIKKFEELQNILIQEMAQDAIEEPTTGPEQKTLDIKAFDLKGTDDTSYTLNTEVWEGLFKKFGIPTDKVKIFWNDEHQSKEPWAASKIRAMIKRLSPRSPIQETVPEKPQAESTSVTTVAKAESFKQPGWFDKYKNPSIAGKSPRTGQEICNTLKTKKDAALTSTAQAQAIIIGIKKNLKNPELLSNIKAGIEKLHLQELCALYAAAAKNSKDGDSEVGYEYLKPIREVLVARAKGNKQVESFLKELGLKYTEFLNPILRIKE